MNGQGESGGFADLAIDSPRYMWLMASVLFAIGATIGAIVLAIPHPETFDDSALWINVVAGFAGAVFARLAAERLPQWPLHVIIVFGILIVARSAYYTGDQAGFFILFCVWIGLYTVFFFPRRVALAYLVVIAVTYAWLLIELDSTAALARWFAGIGTIFLGAFLIDSLVERVRRIARDNAAIAAEREQLMATLAEVARTDDLTGLANRRAWDEALERELKRAGRDESPLCVGIIDLDHFKEFNDLNGHLAGDRMLKQISSAWVGELRASDFLARYGGEEFALALPGCSLDDASVLVERLRAATPERETCSAGIVLWDGSEAGEELVGRADSALYMAKAMGRDRIVAT
jgi:diguanylate cyclase (GGDEF)-like protein